jgi:hypothetical protein
MIKYIVMCIVIIIGYNFVPFQLSTGNGIGVVDYENV